MQPLSGGRDPFCYFAQRHCSIIAKPYCPQGYIFLEGTFYLTNANATNGIVVALSLFQFEFFLLLYF